MAKLTPEQRIDEAIKKLEAKKQKRIAKKKETRERNEEIYRLWLENRHSCETIALKFNLEEHTVRFIVCRIKKEKANQNQDD